MVVWTKAVLVARDRFTETAADDAKPFVSMEIMRFGARPRRLKIVRSYSCPPQQLLNYDCNIRFALALGFLSH